jgi:hypothetical protein
MSLFLPDPSVFKAERERTIAEKAKKEIMFRSMLASSSVVQGILSGFPDLEQYVESITDSLDVVDDLISMYNGNDNFIQKIKERSDLGIEIPSNILPRIELTQELIIQEISKRFSPNERGGGKRKTSRRKQNRRKTSKTNR